MLSSLSERTELLDDLFLRTAAVSLECAEHARRRRGSSGKPARFLRELRKRGNVLGRPWRRAGVHCLKEVTKEDLVLSLRRQSKGYSRGSSKYRGVTRHQKGRWEARIGNLAGKKYRYLGLPPPRGSPGAARRSKRGKRLREAQKDPEKMKEYVNGLRALNDQGFTRWTDQHKRDLGQWFSDYLEANGYMNPTTNQRLFKTVIMSAFPPLGDGKACDTWEGYIANPVPTWFLIDAWMAGHLKLQSMTDRDFEAYSKVRMNTSILLPGMS